MDYNPLHTNNRLLVIIHAQKKQQPRYYFNVTAKVLFLIISMKHDK